MVLKVHNCTLVLEGFLCSDPKQQLRSTLTSIKKLTFSLVLYSWDWWLWRQEVFKLCRKPDSFTICKYIFSCLMIQKFSVFSLFAYMYLPFHWNFKIIIPVSYHIITCYQIVWKFINVQRLMWPCLIYIRGRLFINRGCI